MKYDKLAGYNSLSLIAFACSLLFTLAGFVIPVQDVHLLGYGVYAGIILGIISMVQVTINHKKGGWLSVSAIFIPLVGWVANLLLLGLAIRTGHGF